MPARKEFDPNHPRCIFPKFGQIVDAAMTDYGFSAAELARLIGVDASAVRGYRRGFSRCNPARTKLLEHHLGVNLTNLGGKKSPINRSFTKIDMLIQFAKQNGIEIVTIPLSAPDPVAFIGIPLYK